MLLLLLVVVVVKRIITDQSEREEGKKNRDVLTETRRRKDLKKTDFCIKKQPNDISLKSTQREKKTKEKTKNCSRIIAVLLFSSRSLFSVFVRLRRVFALFVLL